MIAINRPNSICLDSESRSHEIFANFSGGRKKVFRSRPQITISISNGNSWRSIERLIRLPSLFGFLQENETTRRSRIQFWVSRPSDCQNSSLLSCFPSSYSLHCLWSVDTFPKPAPRQKNPWQWLCVCSALAGVSKPRPSRRKLKHCTANLRPSICHIMSSSRLINLLKDEARWLN